MRYWPLLALLLVGCEKHINVSMHQTQTVDPNARQIFVFIGHSNMSGRGTSPSSFAPDPRITMVGRDHEWRVASEPTDLVDVAAKVSPTVAFANAYLANHPDKTVGIINCAAGGSTTSQWMHGYPLFNDCATFIYESKAFGQIAGLMVWSGENDQIVGQDWTEGMTNIVRDFRGLVNNPNLPVAFVEAPSTYPRTELASLRSQQEALHISGVTRIPAEGFPTEDGVHITTDSQEILGQRFANAF